MDRPTSCLYTHHQHPGDQAVDLVNVYIHGDETSASGALIDIVDRITPAVRRVARTIPEDAEEIFENTVVQLIRELGARRVSAMSGDITRCSQEERRPILDLIAYTVSLARNAVSSQLRQKYPARYRVQRQTIYVLDHWMEPQSTSNCFSRWGYGRHRLCGLAIWNGQCIAPGDRYFLLDQSPERILKEDSVDVSPDASLGPLIKSIFDWVGSPLDVNTLIRTIGCVRGIQDSAPLPLFQSDDRGAAASGGVQEPADSRRSPEEELILSESLRSIWREIQSLSPDRCAAILLDREVIDLLLYLNIANLDEIAALVGWDRDTFHQVYVRMPISDAELGHHLGIPITTLRVSRMRTRQMLARTFPDLLPHRKPVAETPRHR